jgi:uncharacterized repeat protein (TIGR03803 family)
MKFNQVLHVAAMAAVLVPAAQGGSKFKVLHDFGMGGDGVLPYGPLLVGKRGSLYGVTIDGGTGKCSDYGCGTVFELTLGKAGWSETVLHNFVFSEGTGPNGSLALDSEGNLYGTTTSGGPDDVGTVYELSPTSDGWTLGTIYPSGSRVGLVSDKAGDLYGFLGTGSHQAGAIAELSPGSGGWAYAALYSFCSQNHCDDGFGPADALSWDAKGNLYGTTYHGGDGYGVAFELRRATDPATGSAAWTYHVLHRFGSYKNDGQNPDGGLVVDASGNAYGVAALGGVHGTGTVFELTPSSAGDWKQTVLYDFPDCANGCLPGGTLAFDKAGNLYGAASGGIADCGGYACGVVFKLAPQTGGRWRYSVLHKFDGADGEFPYGVTSDDKGNLFGVTTNGGTYNEGVAFEITP